MLRDPNGVYYVDDVASCAGEIMTRNATATAAVLRSGGLTAFGLLLCTPDVTQTGVLEGIVPLLHGPPGDPAGARRVAALCIAIANAVRGGSATVVAASGAADRWSAVMQGMGLLREQLDASAEFAACRILGALSACLSSENAGDAPDGLTPHHESAVPLVADPSFTLATPDIANKNSLLRLFRVTILCGIETNAIAHFSALVMQSEIMDSPSRGCQVIDALLACVAVCPAVALETLRSESLVQNLFEWGAKHADNVRCAEALFTLIPELISAAETAEVAEAAALHGLGSTAAFTARIAARIARLLVASAAAIDAIGWRDESEQTALAAATAVVAQIMEGVSEYEKGHTAVLLDSSTDSELRVAVAKALAELPELCDLYKVGEPLEGECLPWDIGDPAPAAAKFGPWTAAHRRKAARHLRALLARGASKADRAQFWVRSRAVIVESARLLVTCSTPSSFA